MVSEESCFKWVRCVVTHHGFLMARHGQREGLAFYRTPRQCLLQLLDAHVGDLRLSEVYDLQVRETIEMRKPSIGDVRVM